MPKSFSPDQLKLVLLLAGLAYLLTAPSGNSNSVDRPGSDRANPFSLAAQSSGNSSGHSSGHFPGSDCPSDRRLVQLPSDAVLNVRQSPNGTVLTTLRPGSPVTLQQADPSGQWSWVALGSGGQGWVFNQYLRCG